jgi:DNA-binding CsgD family transcriptional regulator
MAGVPVTTPAEIRRRRDELVLRAQRADDAADVFAAASTRLRRLVPFDAAVWLTTDPGTGLPTAPTLVDNFELDGQLEQCSALWRREFLVEDVNLYRDIARAAVPAAAPGLLLFDRAGVLVSANEQARAWLAELPHDQDLPSQPGVAVPMWMLATVFRALAVVDGRGDGTARARVRTRRGSWLVCHASSLRDAGGALGSIAVVVEPAKAAEIAPIIVQAYDLSEREQQITRLIARGAGTADIAEELFLSAHTVRDYVKAVFQKVGVTSRAEHDEPVHTADVARILDT